MRRLLVSLVSLCAFALAPALGAHTSEVLRTLGYDAQGVARLLASGVCALRDRTGPT